MPLPARTWRRRESMPEPAIGDQIGRDRIVFRLGVGGMGVIFQADDPDLGCAVAIACQQRFLSHCAEVSK